MSAPMIDADCIVGDVMAAWPQTVAVFVRRRMHCPGCPMSPFMTLAEVAAAYEIDGAGLVGELRTAAASAAQQA